MFKKEEDVKVNEENVKEEDEVNEEEVNDLTFQKLELFFRSIEIISEMESSLTNLMYVYLSELIKFW